MRQNIEDSFRRFESSLAEQLDQALKPTREAMQLALDRRAAQSEAIKGEIEQANRSVTELSNILMELEEIAPDLKAPRSTRDRDHVEIVPRPRNRRY
jgi:hypothetical protein